jgi:hypothetical protein
METYLDIPESRSLSRYAWHGAIGGAIGLLAAGGIYAAAAGGVAMIGGSFHTQESSAHARSLEFSTEASRASAEHDADRVACARLSEKRRACNAAAKQRNAAGL